ncbi:MAG: PEP-CTERM system histidine kinase PrsK, partial [Sphingomonadaceae bacterium]|nr:PEP-CTERM system histidine kinase PrsK [Sphingomonadaceae bacterium]
GYAPIVQLGLIAAMSAAALLLLPSRRARAWLRVEIAKHIFKHRYDYRAEWMRFNRTLGESGPDAATIDARAIRAIADITESPGGALLECQAGDAFVQTSQWQWPGAAFGRQVNQSALIGLLEETGHIVEIDAPSGDTALPEGLREAAPGWLASDTRAWALVPLIHSERLVGAVVLARPLVDRTLDWEDFDLLRIAGRQVASHLAEARGQEALSEARRFDEFNRRFAFIMHDIKNLVSQLSLVARNAERHADNPAFRADMVATLQDSVGKMNELLARLSQHQRGRSEEPRATSLRAIAGAVVAQKAVVHPVELEAGSDVLAIADPARLETVLGHLVQNAIDASPPGATVWVGARREGMRAAISVLDHGVGMTAEFIRSGLFKPFASSKAGGFGIGAFEARALVAEMNGRIEVESRPGEGSRFTVWLPIAGAEAVSLFADPPVATYQRKTA